MVTVMAIDPQWWWSTVFMPAAGGIGWLLKHWYDTQQAGRADKHADRSDEREDRSASWTEVKEANTILSSQVQGLEAKVQQFDPTLAQIQKEYRDTLGREMEGLERERDLRVRLVDLEADSAEKARQASAAQMLRRENQMLRAFIAEKLGKDQIPSRLEIEGFTEHTTQTPGHDADEYERDHDSRDRRT